MAESAAMPLSGSNVADVGSHAWSNPDYIFSSNDTGATCDIDPYASSNYLWANTFLLSIPSGSTINGITVWYRRQASDIDSIRDSIIKLVIAGVVSGDNKADTVTAWSSSWEDVYRGGSNDLWGLSLSEADVGESAFGVVISAGCQGYSTTQARVDYIEVIVTYTGPDGSVGSASCSMSVSGVGESAAGSVGSSAAVATASGDGASVASGAGAASTQATASAAAAVDSLASGASSASLSCSAESNIIKLPSQSATAVLAASHQASCVLRSAWNVKVAAGVK